MVELEKLGAVSDKQQNYLSDVAVRQLIKTEGGRYLFHAGKVLLFNIKV